MAQKRLAVGERVALYDADQQRVEGTIIDYEEYPDQGRILMIQLKEGGQKEVSEKSVKAVSTKRAG